MAFFIHVYFCKYHDIFCNWRVRVHLDMGKGNRTPDDALNLAQEVQALRKKVKTLERENKRLTEENELLADASAFFAASRRKSGKTSE